MIINKKLVTKIGVVIADDQEYIPFVSHFSKYPNSGRMTGGFPATEFELPGFELFAVHCGIGKVNAAAATATLIHAEGCELIINEGLSGGVKAGISSIVVGERFVEHDFDLRPIGFNLAQKPGEDMFIYADEGVFKLVDKIKSAVITRGTFGSGDSFIADAETSKMFEETFGEIACDMESAAIASVCKRNNIPFLSIRKVSDGANEESSETYREMNDKQEKDLAKLIEEMIN